MNMHNFISSLFISNHPNYEKENTSCATLHYFILATNTFAQLKQWTPEQSLKKKNISAVRPSPDGKKVLYTVREAVMKGERSEYLNKVFVCNANGSKSIQLTRGDKNSSNPKW